MKAASAKLAFSIIFFILTSSSCLRSPSLHSLQLRKNTKKVEVDDMLLAASVQFRRMIGAQAPSYQCKTDADCERQCDAGVCEKICLELPSICVDGLCACPFGPGHSAAKTLTNSTCTLADDCSKLCLSDCNIRSCLKGKCQCGCQG